MDMSETDGMDEIVNEQEWLRWRIVQQMELGKQYGDFSQREIEETMLAFGFRGNYDRH